MLKPDSCKGCPLYGAGSGFVPDQHIEGATTLILLQNPGALEEHTGVPAVGDTGKMMNESFIPLAGLNRHTVVHATPPYVTTDSDVSVANVLKCRYTEEDGSLTNNLPPPEILAQATEHCTNAHLRIPESITHIVAQGSLAFNYVSDGRLRESNGKPSTVTDWRGHVLPVLYMGRPVFQVLHLADLFRDPKQRWIAEQDWRKIARFRDGRYPQEVPFSLVVRSIEDWGKAYEWFQLAMERGATVYCDTEFIPDTGYLTVLGLGYRDTASGVVSGLQIDFREKDGVLKEQVAWQFKGLAQKCIIVYHNAMADIPILEKNLGVKYTDYIKIEDTMLAHATLWGELPHTLDFCGSIYNKYPRLKNLAGDDLVYYNWGDVLATLCVWEALEQDLRYDKGASDVYRQQLLPLIPILIDAHTRGIRINPERILEIQPILAKGMDLANRLARVGCGREINLGSPDQLKYQLHTVNRYPEQKNKDTKRVTTDDDAIGVLRELVGPAFDSKVTLTFDMAVDRILAGADPVLEARVLFVQFEHILNNYIFPLHKEVKNANGKSKSGVRKRLHKAGGRWERGDLSLRIYPHITTHVQKSGRHSTSDPPLAQLPAEYRDIIVPDPGTVWLKWDWSAIEPRLLEALCGSRILKRSFDDGIDLHTWTVCEVFGYQQPPDLVNPHKCKCETKDCDHERWRKEVLWKGKEDPRRVFAKAGRYEVWYGGTGSNAAAAASRFGLDRKLLKAAVQKLASSDIDYYQWRGVLESDVKRTRIVRSWAGRPRRLLGQGPGVIREALNHPMQAGVSDIYNLTIIELARVFPFAKFVFGMHDSQWWQIPIELLTSAVFKGFQKIVEQERNINGVVRPFPADFELTDVYSNYYGKSHDLSITQWLAGERYKRMCSCPGCEGRTYYGS